jgi:hypothetical protein
MYQPLGEDRQKKDSMRLRAPASRRGGASPSFRRRSHRLAQSGSRSAGKKCMEARKKLAQEVRTLNDG